MSISIFDFELDPKELGLDLSWDEFQAALADEFKKSSHPPPPESERDGLEYADYPTVLDVLLSPADALQLCENFRKRVNCNLVDSMILRILWKNRKAIDGGEFY
jgi:hypothetical protein